MRNVKADLFGTKVAPARPTVTKASAVNGAILAMTGGSSAIWHDRDYAVFSREGYMANADVYACINWIATAIKGIAFYAYQIGKDGKSTQLEDGPAYEIARRPNPSQAWPAFIEQLVSNLLIYGNAYIERVGPRPGAMPTELWIQRPDRMKIIPGTPQQLIAGYEYQPWFSASTGTKSRWLCEFIRRNKTRNLEPVQQILHIKLYHPLDDWYGLGPLAPASRSVDQNNAAEEWNASMLQNGAQPGGILGIKEATPEQAMQVQDDFNRKHSGRANVGKTLVTNGEATYQRLSQTAQEMSWLEGQELATTRICAVFGVPNELIGATKFRTYNNMHEANRAGYLNAALPKFDHILGDLNYWLAPYFGEDIEFGYDKTDIEAIQEDRKATDDRALNGLKAGAITVDDYREQIGLDPLPNGNGLLLLVPNTSTPTPADKLDEPKPVAAPMIQPALPGAPKRPQLVAAKPAA